MSSTSKCAIFVLFLCIGYVKSDDIDNRLRKGVMLKLLRETVNQTKADTLNLPANSTTIRENITDTFSCENRTYGYYADVDNDCQVFHVCLTQKAASQRNMTFRWSFICPNETIFNQAVLTCTRPIDSINCEDAPMYYDVNMDIGKVPNDTSKSNEQAKEKDSEMIEKVRLDWNKGERNKGDSKRKQTNRKKQNLIQMLQGVVKEDIIDVDDIGEIENLEVNVEGVKADKERDAEVKLEIETKPVIHEVGKEYEIKEDSKKESRIIAERSLKRRGKKYRGSFRFKADVK